MVSSSQRVVELPFIKASLDDECRLDWKDDDEEFVEDLIISVIALLPPIWWWINFCMRLISLVFLIFFIVPLLLSTEEFPELSFIISWVKLMGHLFAFRLLKFHESFCLLNDVSFFFVVVLDKGFFHRVSCKELLFNDLFSLFLLCVFRCFPLKRELLFAFEFVVYYFFSDFRNKRNTGNICWYLEVVTERFK